MKELKEITVCVVPFMVSALLLYPFMAIVGADTDPFMWGREDRMFYFVSAITFGGALLYRIMYVRERF